MNRFISPNPFHLDIHLHDPTITLLKIILILKTDRMHFCLFYRNTLLSMLSSTVTGFQPLPLKQIVDVKGQGWSTALLFGKHPLIS